MILCIDTITEFAGIALTDGRRCHAYLPLRREGIAETILKVIDQALRKARIKPANLTGVLVIKGPGSFTSLRVGLAVANQFAHQLKIPIIGLRTDEWWMHRTQERPVVYLQSMNREEVYVAGHDTPRIEKLCNLRPAKTGDKFLGYLSEEHKARLPFGWQSARGLLSPKKAWTAAARAVFGKRLAHRRYALVEPFYGKEPTITKNERKPILLYGL